MKKNFVLVIVIVLLSIYAFGVYNAFAIPLGPQTLTSGASARADINYSLKNASAIAGNVTQIDIVANVLTKAWQGYYGEITGRIVLADANANKFYDWNLTTPTGEVFASPNASINWADIKCLNFTANESALNLTAVELLFGIAATDADGFDITYNQTTNSAFTVGAESISANTCPTTYMFENSTYQSSNFQNVLLTDNVSLVFTSLINNNKYGFNNVTHDFQLLVAENGHGSDTTVTPYFFWIELS